MPTVSLDPWLADIEAEIFDRFTEKVKGLGFKRLGVPSIVPRNVIDRQQCVRDEWVFPIDDEHVLAGSAEQGILSHFLDSAVNSTIYFAKNQCFRREAKIVLPYRLYEFNKLELFSFSHLIEVAERSELLLHTPIEFLEELGVKWRVVDVTDRDPGYHIWKKDIEVWCNRFGWVETHSCTYFGEEQTHRMGITGATHTISNTGIASPRILLPFMDGTTEWKT